MLYTKFQASEPNGSKAEVFSYVFLCLEPRTPGAGPFKTLALGLNELGKGPLGL